MVDIVRKMSEIITGKEFKEIDEKQLDMTREEKFYAKKEILEWGIIISYFILGGIIGIAVGMVTSKHLLSYHIFEIDWIYILSVVVIFICSLSFLIFFVFKYLKPEYNNFKKKYKNLIDKVEANNDIYKYKSKIIRNSYIRDIKHIFYALLIITILLVMMVYPLVVEPSVVIEYPTILFSIGWFIVLFWYLYRRCHKKINEREEAIEKIKEYNEKKEM